MSSDGEPHFGEVWKWTEMGPYMIIGLVAAREGEDVLCVVITAEDEVQGRVTSLHWGGSYRKHWHRIDEGELV